jgi:RecA-family ATPase
MSLFSNDHHGWRSRMDFESHMDLKPFKKFAKSAGIPVNNGDEDDALGRSEPFIGATEDEDMDWLCLENVDDLPDKENDIVVEGMLKVGEKLAINAGSKSFKTWLLLHLAYCIANGIPFLGFKTNPMKVAIFDMELFMPSIKRRLRRIQKEMGTGTLENIKVQSLRGKAAKFLKNFDKVAKRLREQGFRVVIIDPVYKFLMGKDENSNGVVAEVLERLTVFCMEAEASLIYVHHHSKGNQSNKEALDRGSGAGAWSRDPDCVLDVTQHEKYTKQDPVYTCFITLRDFPPIDDFVVRWTFPIITRDEQGLDPGALKQANK